MVTHFGILTWRVPRTEETGGLWVHGAAKSRTQLSIDTLESMTVDSLLIIFGESTMLRAE